MPRDNSIFKDYESDIFGLIFLIWENKGLMSIIIALTIIIGSGYYFLSSNTLMSKRMTEILGFLNLSSETYDIEHVYQVKVNLYIEDNQFFTKENIVNRFNERFLSAYNHVEWAKKNKNLSEYLPRNIADLLRVNPTYAHIIINLDTLNSLDALTSYLSYTSIIINNKINDEVKKKYNTRVEDQKNTVSTLKNEINLSNIKREEKIKPYKLNILDINNDILNATIELRNTEKKLNYINNNISTATKNTKDAILLRIELTNTINKYKSTIQNLEYKKENNNQLINTMDKELTSIDFDIKSLQSNLNAELDNLNNEINYLKEVENMQLLRLGEITNKLVSNKLSNIHIIKVLVIYFTIGLILGIFIILIKREFIRRKQIFKL